MVDALYKIDYSRWLTTRTKIQPVDNERRDVLRHEKQSGDRSRFWRTRTFVLSKDQNSDLVRPQREQFFCRDCLLRRSIAMAMIRPGKVFSG
jgi:hypothetical protein